MGVGHRASYKSGERVYMDKDILKNRVVCLELDSFCHRGELR